MFEETFQEHLSALAVRGRNSRICQAPFDEKRDAAATFNAADHSTTTIDTAMASTTLSSKKPNQKQLEFLEHFVRRLKVEWMEKHQGTINVNPDEPLLDLIHGFPGTGKSAAIGWMRQVMEEGLGWEHGVQFVCLAFQNAMAAQINGQTVHHWSGIPSINEDMSSVGDRHKQSMKCRALRVIIIDEAGSSDDERGSLFQIYLKTRFARMA